MKKKHQNTLQSSYYTRRDITPREHTAKDTWHTEHQNEITSHKETPQGEDIALRKHHTKNLIDSVRNSRQGNQKLTN